MRPFGGAARAEATNLPEVVPWQTLPSEPSHSTAITPNARVPESREKNRSDTGNRPLERQQHLPNQSLANPALGGLRESSEGGWPAFEGESRERETLHKSPLSYCVSHRFLYYTRILSH